MNSLPLIVLTRPDTFWRGVRADRWRAHDLLQLAAFTALACGVYGAIMAGWRSPRLALYVGIKLPMMVFMTTGTVSVFNWMAALALGCSLGYRQTLFLAAGAMAVSGWLLLALAPVALMFIVSSVPGSGTGAELRYAHNVMLLTHIAVLAGAGVAGNARLLAWLRTVASTRARARTVFIVWLAVFAFVGCQASWLLRPFVGSPFYPVVFLRPDALERNFYEFVLGDVLPYVLNGGDRP
ncbi:MAG: hypothetical protein K8T26_10660 [Lentisphaerae bacterium]|nr:hypothetical protein [Lentisphaerota bacterium]